MKSNYFSSHVQLAKISCTCKSNLHQGHILHNVLFMGLLSAFTKPPKNRAYSVEDSRRQLEYMSNDHG